MAHLTLSGALVSFNKSLAETANLVAGAAQWTTLQPPQGVLRFSQKHREYITELGFLRAFLAWEEFIEETFTLYLLGKSPPRGRPPHRYVEPPTRTIAEQLIVPERRQYVRWTIAAEVAERADRFFRNGKPFSPTLRPQTNMFDDMRTIRNAIAHAQAASQNSFKSLVRRNSPTGTFPPNLTIGGFLNSTVPASAPASSFFETYVERLRFSAGQIVPM